MHRLQREMRVALGIRDTFAVFEDPRNLERITPPWLNFRILTKNVVMRPGAVIDYEIRWMGVPMKWKTRITEYDAPNRFVDVQERGPYSLWRHLHWFREEAGATVVGDQVDYALPLGPLGDLAHALVVRRQLEQIFDYRVRALSDLFAKAK